MNVRAVYMQNQALLSLYSYSATTGLIGEWKLTESPPWFIFINFFCLHSVIFSLQFLVDMGDHVDVLPVIDGKYMFFREKLLVRVCIRWIYSYLKLTLD